MESVQLSAKVGFSDLMSRMRSKPTSCLPSFDTAGRSIQSFAAASVMKLLRALAMRKMRVDMPLCWVTTGYLAKMMRARGRAKRANTRAVITASSRSPVKFSAVATT
jgi:hypothetical protein